MDHSDFDLSEIFPHNSSMQDEDLANLQLLNSSSDPDQQQQPHHQPHEAVWQIPNRAQGPLDVTLVRDKHCQYSVAKEQFELTANQPIRLVAPGRHEFIELWVSHADPTVPGFIRNNDANLKGSPCVVSVLEPYSRVEYSAAPRGRRGWTVRVHPEWQSLGEDQSTEVCFKLTTLSSDPTNGGAEERARRWILGAELASGQRAAIPIQAFRMSRDPERHRKNRSGGRRRRSTSSSVTSVEEEDDRGGSSPVKIIKIETDDNGNSDTYADGVVHWIYQEAGAQPEDEVLRNIVRGNVASFMRAQVRLLSHLKSA